MKKKYVIKSRCLFKKTSFIYAVQSAGKIIRGCLQAVNVERATQEAAWKAQASAYEAGREFDLLNFIVAVRAK